MEKIGIKRFKRHQILISKEAHFYKQKVKMEFNDNNLSSDDLSSDQFDSLSDSIKSADLNDKFKRTRDKKLEEEIKLNTNADLLVYNLNPNL
jgi:hypothetical protein